MRTAHGTEQHAAQLALLLRSAGVAVVLSLPVLSAAPVASGGPSSDDPSLWKASWSERYPGCVAAVLWPADERPVAAVVRTSGGSVVRVSLGESRPTVPGTAAPVGLCR